MSGPRQNIFDGAGGDLDSSRHPLVCLIRELKEVTEKYLLSLQEAEVDTVILACTHYPFIMPLLQSIMSQAVQFIDSARR
jgi:hypothetical protein